MKRPSAMLPQRMRLTCWQSACGSAASEAKARTAACRFDISSAAGMPLPTTSAIVSARRVSLKRIVSKQSPPTPDAGCHETASSQPSICGTCCGSSRVWMRQRFGQLAPLGGVGLAPRAAGLDFLAQRREQVRVVPRLLHEVAHAAAHRLDGEIDAAPAGHDDHRQQRDRAACTRASRSIPSRPDVVSPV